MKNSTKLLSIIIAALLVIIFLQRMFPPAGDPVEHVTIKTDTTYKEITNTVTKKVRLVMHDTTYIPTDTQYVVDTNCEITKARFLKLVKSHVTRNIYADTLTIDSIGKVYVWDTVQFNRIEHRKLTYNYKLPTVTVTKTITLPPRNQLYAGFGLTALYPGTIHSANVGMILKTCKDQIYGAQVGMTLDGYVTYGLSSYWKISFKK